MKKSRMVSVAIAFFLFVSGYGIALGQTDSTQPAGPPTAAEHTDEIGEPDAVHVRIDYKVSGIGSASCGPALDEKYRLCEKKISFAFTMGIMR